MIGVVIATLTNNLAANIVSPANDFSNLNPKRISFKKGALITSCIGVAIFPWKLYNDRAQYLFTWLIGYGSFLGSIAGIMIVDYFLLKKMVLHVEELYELNGRYRYQGGFNIKTLIAMALGIAPNIPGFLIKLNILAPISIFSEIYERGWFTAFIISGLSHFMLAKTNKVQILKLAHP